MIKRLGKCGIGSYMAKSGKMFYFEDDTTEEEMLNELYKWAEQFVEAWFEEVKD